MFVNILSDMRDQLQALFCYQLVITPLPLMIDKKYQKFAREACEFISTKRSNLITCASPRHYVIHHFAQAENPHAKKILITHGWMSRAAYMANLINALHQQGFEIYALDFPAHGEAPGWQLPWTDAARIIKETLNTMGPFYAAIGHSFGGSMILNALNLSTQLPEWELYSELERVVLLASPTCMRRPVADLARRLHMSGTSLIRLREIMSNRAHTDLGRLNYRYFINQHKTPLLCVHGKNDNSVHPRESILFCRSYPYGSLALLPEIDHTNILINECVTQRVCDFLI